MKYDFKNKISNPHFPGVIDVNPQEICDNNKTLAIIDVRQPEEFTGELGHIENAQLFVLGELPQKISSLPKDQTIVFVCRSGGRSAQAAAFAASQGFADVYNMRGGMLLWNQLQLPLGK